MQFIITKQNIIVFFINLVTNWESTVAELHQLILNSVLLMTKLLKPEMKENMILSCQSPGYAVKSSKGTKAKKLQEQSWDKMLFVPPLDGLNEHREFSECATGFILSPRADKPYQCHFCAKQFKYFSNLKSHMNIIHSKLIENSPKDSKTSTVGSGQVFQCEICLRNFKYFSNLRTHRLVHTSEVETCNSGID